MIMMINGVVDKKHSAFRMAEREVWKRHPMDSVKIGFGEAP